MFLSVMAGRNTFKIQGETDRKIKRFLCRITLSVSATEGKTTMKDSPVRTNEDIHQVKKNRQRKNVITSSIMTFSKISQPHT